MKAAREYKKQQSRVLQSFAYIRHSLKSHWTNSKGKLPNVVHGVQQKERGKIVNKNRHEAKGKVVSPLLHAC